MPEGLRLRRIGLALLETGIARPRLIIRGALVVTLVLGLLILRVQTATDPEDMLSSSDPVRLRTGELSEQFGSTNSILVGLSRDSGIVTVEFLAAPDRLIDEALDTDGVIAAGVVSYRLANDPYVAPATQTDADALATAVARNELLSGLALSAAGRGVSVLLPLATKGVADDVADHVRDLVSADPTLAAADLNIAGLPLAEERFGEEMFLQMALFALGFIPLLFASLVPYIIVGALLLTMMSLSWLATVVVLPGLVCLFDAYLPRSRTA